MRYSSQDVSMTREWPLASTLTSTSATGDRKSLDIPSKRATTGGQSSSNRRSDTQTVAAATPTKASPRSPSLKPRKSFSLALPKRSSAPAPPLPQQPAAAAASSHHARSPSLYYNDPDARRTLRRLLASPQSFEEALAFGFPSAAAVNTSPPCPQPAPVLPAPDFSASPSGYTFFRDSSEWTQRDEDDEERDGGEAPGRESRSYYDDLYDLYDDAHDDDTASEYDTGRNSPLTPVDHIHPDAGTALQKQQQQQQSAQRKHDDTTHFHTASQDTAPLYHAAAGGHRSRQTWDGGFAAARGREMTLRLTLTKPGLRDADDATDGATKYAAYVRGSTTAFPRASEAINHDVFRPDIQEMAPGETGRVKGLWRKLKSRR